MKIESKPKMSKLLGPKSKRKIKITTKENVSDESNYQETDQTNDAIDDSNPNSTRTRKEVPEPDPNPTFDDLEETEFVILSEETVNSLSCPVCFEVPKYDASIADPATLLPISGFVLDEKFQENASKFAIFHI